VVGHQPTLKKGHELLMEFMVLFSKSLNIDFSQLKAGDILYDIRYGNAFTVIKITDLNGIEHLQMQNNSSGSELILSRHGVALRFKTFPNCSSERGLKNILNRFTNAIADK
jgi:hypothetical protein